ncbi:MAG: DMT family transporter [Ignavibacteria bacterium]|nr:DMT family transporter [Ignavibacteria bacterium]
MGRLAPLSIIIAASLWGFDGIVLRPSLYNLPVPLVVFVESTIVALILSPIFFKNRSKIFSLDKKDWIAFFLVALTGGAIGTMAITKALFYVNFVNLSIVILIQKLQPVFAIVLAAIFLREKLSKEFFIWAGFAIAGAYLLTFGFSIPVINSSDKTTIAAVLSLIAAISFGSSTVFSKRALRNVNFELGTYLRFGMATVIMLIITIYLGQLSSIDDIQPNQWFIFLVIALTTGGAAIFLYYYGLKKITASVATICELAFPLTAVILEYLIHDNIIGPVQWIGVLILIVSIIKVSSLKSR